MNAGMGLRRPLAIVVALAALAVGAASPLASAPSGYVRAQAGAKVAWHPWDEVSLEKARAAGKCVYVLVGSELSELTRSTTGEILARDETAAWLNGNFFCIFVDADTQPEVAAYAQHFINAARQLRGWPVHLWLTPDLQPYDGANYLPPTEEWGRPGFLKSARAALEAWTAEPGRARAMADEAAELMRVPPLPVSGAAAAAEVVEARLARAAEAWVAAADATHGGFGTAPKHPEPELIRFLLTRGPEAQAVALAAARAIVNGGLRDPKDGGFFRRTIDAEWKEPYRQKLVSDQARIALALFDAAAAAKDENLRAAGEGALRFVLGKLRRPEGLAMAWDGTVPEEAGALVGRASVGAEGLLIVALARSGDPKMQAEGRALAAGWVAKAGGSGPISLAHARGGPEPATAGDLLALALGLRAAGEAEPAAALIARANDRHLDRGAGLYMASPATLSAGIAVRVPALSEPLSAEVLALLAGADGETAALLRRALLAQIEYDEQPPGAVLLALAGGE